MEPVLCPVEAQHGVVHSGGKSDASAREQANDGSSVLSTTAMRLKFSSSTFIALILSSAAEVQLFLGLNIVAKRTDRYDTWRTNNRRKKLSSNQYN